MATLTKTKKESTFKKEKVITVTVNDFIDYNSIHHAEFTSKEGTACLIQITPDDYYESPRQWDNLWTWVTTRGAGYSDIKGDTPEKYEDPETGKLDAAWLDTVLYMPLHLYRHSGDFISVGRRSSNPMCNCQWDSGTMGFAFVEKSKLLEEYGVTELTEEIRQSAIARLENEVAAMNACNAGYVYIIDVIDMETEYRDSCGGFICTTNDCIKNYVDDMLSGWVEKENKAAIIEELLQ